VPVIITGGPASAEIKEMPRHKKNPAIGTKKTVYASKIIIEQQDAQAFAIDEEVGYNADLRYHCNVDEYLTLSQITLMDWGNAIVRTITKSSDGVVQGVDMELHLEGDFKKTEKKITWLATSPDAPKPIAATLVDFDYLLTKKKIEEGEDWLSFITPVTEFRKDALVDSNCGILEPGIVIQFERKGYFILDSVKRGLDGQSVIGMDFFLIPDGKIGTVASKADKSGTVPTISAVSKAIYTGGDSQAGILGSSATLMYPVKPTTIVDTIDVKGLKMYTVKPVY
jgi:glutamyl-tRNA synthetase